MLIKKFTILLRSPISEVQGTYLRMLNSTLKNPWFIQQFLLKQNKEIENMILFLKENKCLESDHEYFRKAILDYLKFSIGRQEKGEEWKHYLMDLITRKEVEMDVMTVTQ